MDKVAQKLIDVEEKDQVRNCHPPIAVEEMMELIGLQPSTIVGEITDEIKETILEGKIHNNPIQARELMLEIAKSKGLSPVLDRPNS